MYKTLGAFPSGSLHFRPIRLVDLEAWTLLKLRSVMDWYRETRSWLEIGMRADMPTSRD